MTLDETDMEILTLLAEDARRPFSEIGEQVGLSGPAVSDRVDRLQEAGVIEQFTINVDRAQLRAGVPVLLDLSVPRDAVEAVRERLRDDDAVEHVFVTADGDIVCYGRAEAQNVRAWAETLLEGVENSAYTVRLVDDIEWTPSVDGVEFALTCAECGNTVDSEGETARIGGEVYHFCCSSCLRRFRDRYQDIEAGV